MQLDFTAMDRRTAYTWMTAAIAPRPIAWVSTIAPDGTPNIAPFSFFQMVTPAPPTLLIVPQHHPDNSLKDTARNIGRTGEFVVNLVSFDMVQQMNATSFRFPEQVSEFDACGLAPVPSQVVAPPRVAGAPMSFECTVVSIMPYPPAAPTCAVIMGSVVAAHADRGILDATGQIDPRKLDTVSRLGGDWYGRTSSPGNFELPRPT